MKSARVYVFVAVLLLAGMAAAEFPPVPETVDPVRILNFGDEADFFVWTQDGKLYLRVQLLSEEFFQCSVNFALLQSDGAGGFAVGRTTIVREEGGSSVCENIFADETFLVEKTTGTPIDFTKPLELYCDTGEGSILIDVFTVGAKLAPINGIWRNEDGTLSVYIQKYQAQSAVAVATQDGIDLVAFLDPDISDGFSADNDVGSRGFGISFVFHSSTTATVTVDLPTGTVTTDMSLAFPDMR